MKHWAGRFGLATLAWTAIGAAFALPYLLLGLGIGTLLTTLLRWWLWGALAPLIAAIDGRLAASLRRPLPLCAAHAVAALTLTALYVAVAATLEHRLGLSSLNPLNDLPGALESLLRNLLVYGLILAGVKAYKAWRRRRADALKLERLERSFVEARLNALRMQLDPHFLFNSLNGISAHIGYEPALARQMLDHLADLLRLSLDTRNRQQVSLAEELAFLEHYLALHRMRFGELLAVTVTVAPEVQQVRIPSLLLQPLVENAIRHGIAGRVGGGAIAVTARPLGRMLEIRVIDDGIGLPPGWRIEQATGIGLNVTRERLAAMYPDGGSTLAVVPYEGGGTEARIVLPL